MRLPLQVAAAAAAVAAAAAFAPVAGATTGDLWITASTTLTEDHQGSIQIAASGVTLDCAGHTVSGSAFAGIRLDNVSSVTIRNCTVTGFSFGFFVSASNGNQLVNDVGTANSQDGFALASGSTGNTLSFDRADENGSFGFAVDSSSSNTLSDDTATGNADSGFGVLSGGAGNHFVRDLSRSNSVQGFALYFCGAGNEIDSSTAVDNGAVGMVALGPTCLGTAISDSFASGSTFAGFAIVDGARNAALTRDTASGNKAGGFFFRGTSGNLVTGSTADGNVAGGFTVSPGASSNTFSNDVATANTGHGFVADGAFSNIFTQSRSAGNHDSGFALINGASGNTISGDVADDNVAQGYALYSAGPANQLTGDTAHGNGSTGFAIISSSFTTLTGANAVQNAVAGIDVVASSNVTVDDDSAQQNGGAGFNVDQVTAASFRSDVANGNAVGFELLAGCAQVVLAGDTANANARFGYSLEPGATGDTVRDSAGHANGVLDADDANGAGANAWTADRFGSSNLG